MDDLYREQILEHYKQPHNWGELEDPDLEFEDFNPLCGDELKVQLKVGEDEKIIDVRFSGHGCAISQATGGSPLSMKVAKAAGRCRPRGGLPRRARARRGRPGLHPPPRLALAR